MRVFPSCFCENGVQIADYSFCTSVDDAASKASHDLVTCIHQCKLLGKPCLISIMWSKNALGQCFSVEANDLSHQCLYRLEVKPSLFIKSKGSKHFHVNSAKVHIFWDLRAARFGSGPEPLEGYYLAVVYEGEMVLAVGDLKKKAFKKVNVISSLFSPQLISKRIHIFGKRVYGTKAQFCDDGQIHDLKIECQTDDTDDPKLVIRLDGKTVMQVKHLRWKFRGNYTILVKGLPVEVFWDVYNWLFGTASFGSAVFVFQTCHSAEKLWKIQTLPDVSILPWPPSGSVGDDKLPSQGFSLVLNIWKNE